MRPRLLLPSFVLLAALTAPKAARADGTYFVVELNSGVGESAYTTSSIGFNYGVSLGTTFKLRALPIRWYVLASLIGRNASTSGTHHGVPFVADRVDLDVFGAVRSVLPVWRMLRIYAEVGVGQRHLFQTIRRGGELGTIDGRETKLLLVVGLGLQARLTKTFSVGLRGEMTPIGAEADLATYVADVVPTKNRLAGFATLGVHF